MITSQILNFTEKPLIDESIEKYQWHGYNPVVGTNLNAPGEISIDIVLQSLFAHPSKSYLLFEGRLTKADNTPYADDDNIALVNNGLMHLFSQISYQLSEKEIEAVYHPGQVTTMLGMLTDDIHSVEGLDQLWCRDTTTTASIANNAGFAARQAYLIQKPHVKGTFRFIIPLKHIFGFCDDYDKIVYGVTHKLTLVRKADDDSIFRANDVDAGKVTLNKISWFMPHVIPNDMDKLQLYKTIESKASLPMAYRVRRCATTTVPQTDKFEWSLGVKISPEKPRYIIVGFQTGKGGNQERNPSIFDHCNLKNMCCMLNDAQYPAINYDLSFPNQQFSEAYRDAKAFGEIFYGVDSLIKHNYISPADFKDLFPIFVFDVSKQSERLKTSVVTVDIHATFNEDVPAATRAFAVMVSDRLLTLQSDGDKMAVVY